MNIERLPSGSYRARIMKDGKSYRFTFDHKPSEMEVIESIANEAHRAKKKPKKDMTILECITMYVDYKKDNLSPKTRAEYLKLENRLSKAFLGTLLSEVEQDTIDDEINRLKARRLSAKTIKNYMQNVRTPLKKYYPTLDVSYELIPAQKTKDIDDEPYIPTKEEVRQLLDYTNKNDPMFYIPFALAAMCGLRREEIIALDIADIDSEYNLHIRNAIVNDENNEWVEKDTKTNYSTRTVPIPKKLADRIKLQGYVYNGHPGSIGKALRRIENELGMKKFTLHKLRHYYVTELWDAGMQEADILYLSGHSKRSDINKIIYRHSRIKYDKKRRQELANKINSYFFGK